MCVFHSCPFVLISFVPICAHHHHHYFFAQVRLFEPSAEQQAVENKRRMVLHLGDQVKGEGKGSQGADAGGAATRAKLEVSAGVGA